MRRISRRPALAAVLGPLLATLLVAPATAGDLAIRAGQVHVGDGRVLGDTLVVVTDGRIASLQPGGQRPPAGVDLLTCEHLVPGLLAADVRAGEPGDARSVEPGRRAIDLVGPIPDEPLLANGVTSLVLAPGRTRLVPGRLGVVRLHESSFRWSELGDGPPVAVLAADALFPPPLHEPQVPINIDNPYEPAKQQRPSTLASAAATLRSVLTEAAQGEGHEAYRQVVRRELPFRVVANTELEIAAALRLASEHGLQLVIVGGAEAWTRADELAAADALVLLTRAAPGLGQWRSGLRTRPDNAARLAEAGVEVALAADGHPDPLLIASAAVRSGLPEHLALAAVTGRAARAAGVTGLGVIEPGAAADLVGLDDAPLSLRAQPSFVVVDGDLRHETASSWSDSEWLVLKAGRLHDGTRWHDDARVVIRDDRVVAVGDASASIPRDARVLDFGPDASITPGLIDGFSLVGLDPGSAPGGGARVKGSAAMERNHPTIQQARAAGLTSGLIVPATSGLVRGQADLVAFAEKVSDDDEHHDDAPARLPVLTAGPAMVFVLDGGPSDGGTRGPRIQGLKKTLGQARSYHQSWLNYAEAKKKAKKSGGKKNARGKAKSKKAAPSGELANRFRSGRHDVGGPRSGKTPSGKSAKAKGGQRPPSTAPKAPEKNPELEPYRDLFRGKKKVLLRAGRHDTILAGVDAVSKMGLKPILVGAEEADLVAEQLAAKKVPVLLRPDLQRSDAGRQVVVAAELAAAGVKVVFGSQRFGAAAELPLASAAAVRGGLSPEDALTAMTGRLAETLGLPAGRLRAGSRADFAVFSGDPLEPSSRVLAVGIDGRLVHEWGDDQGGWDS